MYFKLIFNKKILCSSFDLKYEILQFFIHEAFLEQLIQMYLLFSIYILYTCMSYNFENSNLLKHV